ADAGTTLTDRTAGAFGVSMRAAAPAAGITRSAAHAARNCLIASSLWLNPSPSPAIPAGCNRTLRYRTPRLSRGWLLRACGRAPGQLLRGTAPWWTCREELRLSYAR